MVSAGIQPTLLLCDGAKKFSILQVTNRSEQFSAQPWWFNFGFSCTAFIWSDVFDKLVKWLKEVQKGCSDKYRFLFYCGASRATGFPVEPTLLYIFSFGFKLVHISVPTFVCNREVLIGISVQILASRVGLCLSVYLVRVLIRLVRAGHVFSFKLLTNIYKLNVFGRFLVRPDLYRF